MGKISGGKNFFKGNEQARSSCFENEGAFSNFLEEGLCSY